MRYTDNYRENFGIVYCDAVYFGKYVPTFRKKSDPVLSLLSYLSANWLSVQPGNWRQHIPTKHLYTSIKLQAATYQKTGGLKFGILYLIVYADHLTAFRHNK